MMKYEPERERFVGERQCETVNCEHCSLQMLERFFLSFVRGCSKLYCYIHPSSTLIRYSR